MEIRWLEDLLCVAAKGHFARAAEERHTTQSTLSRHIKSLEMWVGTELLDRSQHPIRLTPAGQEFCQSAKTIVRQAHQARADACQLESRTDNSITLACLHTLALFYIPKLIKKLHSDMGDFRAAIVAETSTIDEYLESLANGISDLFVGYIHPSVPLDLDDTRFPSLTLGVEKLRPYQSSSIPRIDLDTQREDAIPFLKFSGTAFMSKVVESVTQRAPFKKRLQTVYRASLAESLFAAAEQGLGIAWLPDSIVAEAPLKNSLIRVSERWTESMNIAIFRSAANNRPIVNQIWHQLQDQ